LGEQAIAAVPKAHAALLLLEALAFSGRKPSR
jgi:hypothetical protein